MNSQILIALILGLSLAACNGSAESEDSIAAEKAALQAEGGKADSANSANAKICKALGKRRNCDVCALKGWYGDGECDTFCKNPDPDCRPTPTDTTDCAHQPGSEYDTGHECDPPSTPPPPAPAAPSYGASDDCAHFNCGDTDG